MEIRASQPHYAELEELTLTLCILKNRHMYPWFVQLCAMNDTETDMAIEMVEQRWSDVKNIILSEQN